MVAEIAKRRRKLVDPATIDRVTLRALRPSCAAKVRPPTQSRAKRARGADQNGWRVSRQGAIARARRAPAASYGGAGEMSKSQQSTTSKSNHRLTRSNSTNR